ncbi:MAG: type II toxin-antitoxin system HicA family toxin [SAR324 cluster bacterium]|nr:type II toxin-antitoxin system HicA family toxin [SAR324 cluster bacterium]
MKARDLEKLLGAEGWSLVPGRGKGCHRIYKHPDRADIITIPWHKGKDLHPWLLRSILKQADIEG